MTAATAASPPSAIIPTRSMGLKLLLVCGLALLMCIPAVFVFGLLMERTHRAEQVAQEIGGLVGGPQTFLGPVIVVPFSMPPKDANNEARTGFWVVYPASGEATFDTKSSVRKRSLFEVPVYQSDAALHSYFDLSEAEHAAAASGVTLDWSRAELVTGASDPRGARTDVTLTSGGKTVALAPARLAPEVTLNPLAAPEGAGPYPMSSAAGRTYPRSDSIRLFGVDAGSILRRDAPFDVTAVMKFTGARRISVLPFAKVTDIHIKGDWASPSFDGGFLPATRSVTGARNGQHAKFEAGWSIPFIARGLPGAAPLDSVSRLGAEDVGVSFVEPANPYQSVGRSLKYALLFVGLVFLAYFMFETTTGKRVHPAQYVLIGLAQIIFYLLLLSISEHVGFDFGFLIAAGATVGLISLYAGWVFESRVQGLRAFGAFSFLYGLIYILMRLEDYALLVGALASFAAIALVMYFTRRIDWYGGAQLAAAAPKESA
jgi:inner membrane protein